MTRTQGGVVAGLFLALVTGLAAAPAGKADGPVTVTVEGKLVRLVDLLTKKHRASLDADAAKTWLGVETADGKFVPVLKNAGATMLFAEPQLRGRKLRIEARRYPGIEMLDVIAFHTIKAGRPHTIYYWCDECAIRVGRPGVCPCCPLQVVLREEPVAQ